MRASKVWGCSRRAQAVSAFQLSAEQSCESAWTHELASEDTLEESGTVTEDNEDHSTLLPEPVDPSEYPHTLAALLDGLLDLDLGSGGGGLLQDDRLGILELLGLSRTLSSTLELVLLLELLLARDLGLVLSVELFRLLDGRGRGGLPRLAILLGLANESGDGLAASDESAGDRLVRRGGRAVSSRVVSTGLVDAVGSGLVCSRVKNIKVSYPPPQPERASARSSARLPSSRYKTLGRASEL